MTKHLFIDLDDTLIDSFNTIIKAKLFDAFKLIQTKLQEQNIILKNEDFQTLIGLNNNSSSGKLAILNFCKQHNLTKDHPITQAAIHDYYHNQQTFQGTLSLFPHTIATLSLLKEQGYELSIVTYGQEDQQRKKIQSTNLPAKLFTNIFITQNRNKQELLKDILQTKQINPSNAVMIGDSLNGDVLAATQNNMHAILMKQGRGKNISSQQWDGPSIESIAKLPELLKTIFSKK